MVLCLRSTPVESTEFSPTITPSRTVEPAPIKQLSSIMTGLACTGSSTPPITALLERCTLLPICAHEPTVAQESIIVFSSIYAPILTKDGMSTTRLPMNAPRHCRRHDAETARSKIARRVIRKFTCGLVIKRGISACLHPRILFNHKGEQNGFFYPLVHYPLPRQRFLIRGIRRF